MHTQYQNLQDHCNVRTWWDRKVRIGPGILMTTHNDFTVQDGLPIRLDEIKMDDVEALKLLLRESTTVTNCDPFALDIIRELGYLPLAIDLAGACIEREGITPAEYLKLLR